MIQILACTNDGKELYIKGTLMYLFFKYISSGQQDWNDGEDFHYINQSGNLVSLRQRSSDGDIEIDIRSGSDEEAMDGGVLDMSDILNPETDGYFDHMNNEELYRSIEGKVNYIINTNEQSI